MNSWSVYHLVVFALLFAPGSSAEYNISGEYIFLSLVLHLLIDRILIFIV